IRENPGASRACVLKSVIVWMKESRVIESPAADLSETSRRLHGPAAGGGSGMEQCAVAPVGTAVDPAARPTSPGPSLTSPDEPPRKPVRARTPLTPQALVDRADVTPRTPEAETVLRIFRRRQQEHAALYVAETRDLASLWSEEDEGDEKALHALAA